jgi:hypothetical protein
MHLLISLSSFLFGISFGIYIHKKIYEYNQKSEARKKRIESENIFKEVLINISNGNSSFKSRYMQTVYISTFLNKEEVNILYLIDNKELAILKDNKVIHTSELISLKLKKSIIEKINMIYNQKINDVVKVFGITISRMNFEKSFNITFDDFQNMNKNFDKEESDIDKIINFNEKKFDIDDILDKINLSGIDSLSDEEKNYLSEYSRTT